MDNLLDQIEASLSSRLYYVSLFSALAVPDIGGAMDASDGNATGARYAAWYEDWARPQFRELVLASMPEPMRSRTNPNSIQNPMTGWDCFHFRCSLLHQGSSQHPKSAFTRILFIEPGVTSNVVHYGRADGALIIDLNRFCREVVSGARLWLQQVQDGQNYKRNYDRFARRHPDGLLPYAKGLPVIG